MSTQRIISIDASVMERAAADLARVRDEIARVIIGQTDVIEGVLICLVAGGHVLLEGVPGLGKTTLLRTLAQVLDLRYSRIQFTPDLMPGDIVGTMVIETGEHGHKGLRFEPGPVFSNLVLADEINRATPKTQSALLEAMQDRTVTSGRISYPLEPPFLVMATENPIEMEGTYPLPEAQLDRFLMKILVKYPSRDELAQIVDLTTRDFDVDVRPILDGDEVLQTSAAARQVIIAPHVQAYAVDLVMATQPREASAPDYIRRYVRYGSSPRGAQALVECARVLAMMRGRVHVSRDDIREVAPAVLRHRLILNYDAHADAQTPDDLISRLLER